VTRVPEVRSAATHSLWTIARIQNTLTSPVLIRRFLLDISHAPGHQVMNVFTAWQGVAATIEANASQLSPSQSTGESLPGQQTDPAAAHASPRHPPTPALAPE
jgi:hypothetical protein